MTDPIADIDAALAEHDFIASGRKGIHAPYHGPFAAVAHMPSVALDLRRLRDGVLAAQSSLGLIACPDCPGGEVVTDPCDECPRCNGTGATTHEDVLDELHAVRSALAARDERIEELEDLGLQQLAASVGARERIAKLEAALRFACDEMGHTAACERLMDDPAEQPCSCAHGRLRAICDGEEDPTMTIDHAKRMLAVVEAAKAWCARRNEADAPTMLSILRDAVQELPR